MTKTFRDLRVDGAFCDALEARGIVYPFPIQELTLPLALDGHDLIGQARTGTGKTLAFGLPLLQRIDPSKSVTQALVVVPTRELCLQVHSDLEIGRTKGLTSISVYGGVGYDEQIDALTSGVHVVVGTPGRLLDHLNRGNLDLSHVTQLVLDEADEMLDMGFLADVERLVEACNGDERHTMLFSATMPTAIVKLARRYMDHPTFTRADHEAKETAPNVEQHFFQVHRMDKPRILARVLQTTNRGGVYVFVRTKHMADRLVNDLDELSIASVAVHGDLRQTTREKNLDRFREGKVTVLVATEVAARGLDVTGVTHVINYDCPDDEKMYLHRIGRTARAGEAGVAVTFAEFNEADRLNVIRKAVGATDSEVEQIFSTSDRLSELFDLPDEAPWSRNNRGGRGKRDDRSGRDVGMDHAGTAASGSPEPTKTRRTNTSPTKTSDGRRPRRDKKTEASTTAGTGAAPGTARPASDASRRRGSSDGRPKSKRSAEGAGGNHDASRARGQHADNEQGSEERAGLAPTERTRTRSRTRARSKVRDTRVGDTRVGDTSEASDGARGDDGEPSTGSRTRPTSDPGTRDASAGRRRVRASEESRTGASTAGARRTTDDAGTTDTRSKQARIAKSDQGGADARSGTRRRSSRIAESAQDEEPSRSGRPATRQRAARGSRDADAKGGTRGANGGRGRSGRTAQVSPREAEPTDRTAVKLERRGAHARGDGQPQLNRPVRVEHLP